MTKKVGVRLADGGEILDARAPRHERYAAGTVSDWRDVVRHKIDIPAAIFYGEESNNLASQRWAQSVILNAKFCAYSAAGQGDHILVFKKPVKFAADLRAFLEH